MRALTASWPPVHYDTYRNAFSELVAKRLVEDQNQSFRITDSGLQAISAAPQAAPAAPTPKAAPRAARKPAPPAPKATVSAMSRLFNGILGRR